MGEMNMRGIYHAPRLPHDAHLANALLGSRVQGIRMPSLQQLRYEALALLSQWVLLYDRDQP